MRIKPTKAHRNILMEVGPGESRLLSETAERRLLFRLKKILVPIDFSERSKKALQYALPFARQFGAEIVCLHVVEIPYGAGEMGFVAEMDAFRRDLVKDTKQRLGTFLQRQADRIRSRGEVRTGVPYHEITQAAEDEDVDLIIMATHGRTGVGRLFMGSTTERVVRHAHCPVLVVRERERDFVADVRPVEKSRAKRRNSGRPRAH